MTLAKEPSPSRERVDTQKVESKPVPGRCRRPRAGSVAATGRVSTALPPRPSPLRRESYESLDSSPVGKEGFPRGGVVLVLAADWRAAPRHRPKVGVVLVRQELRHKRHAHGARREGLPVDAA